MKPLTILCSLLISITVASSALADLGDNAALGYWQAFAQMPQLSDDDRDRLPQWQQADIESQQVKQLLERSQSALKLLVAAAKQEACDWGLDESQGPQLLLPHLAKSRDLTRLAMLDARAKLAAGDADAALAEIAASAKLAVDSGQPPLLVSTLVERSILRTIQDWISDSAAQLTKQQRATLLAKFDDLFPPVKLSASMKAEAAIMLGWLKTEVDNPKFLDDLGVQSNPKLPTGKLFNSFMEKQIVLLDEDYKEMIAVSDGDFETLKRTEDKLISRAQEESRLLTSLLMPTMTRARIALNRSNVQTEMILAGLLQLQGDTDAAHAVKEPEVDRPFKIQQADGMLTITATAKQRDGSPRSVTFKLKQ